MYGTGEEFMPKVELTDRFVSTSKVAAGAAAMDYFDCKTPGLNLRVTSQGLRTWYLVFTSPTDGKRARSCWGAIHRPDWPRLAPWPLRPAVRSTRAKTRGHDGHRRHHDRGGPD